MLKYGAELKILLTVTYWNKQKIKTLTNLFSHLFLILTKLPLLICLSLKVLWNSRTLRLPNRSVKPTPTSKPCRCLGTSQTFVSPFTLIPITFFSKSVSVLLIGSRRLLLFMPFHRLRANRLARRVRLTGVCGPVVLLLKQAVSLEKSPLELEHLFATSTGVSFRVKCASDLGKTSLTNARIATAKDSSCSRWLLLWLASMSDILLFSVTFITVTSKPLLLWIGSPKLSCSDIYAWLSVSIPLVLLMNIKSEYVTHSERNLHRFPDIRTVQTIH